jgi:hypothetical protein
VRDAGSGQRHQGCSISSSKQQIHQSMKVCAHSINHQQPFNLGQRTKHPTRMPSRDHGCPLCIRQPAKTFPCSFAALGRAQWHYAILSSCGEKGIKEHWSQQSRRDTLGHPDAPRRHWTSKRVTCLSISFWPFSFFAFSCSTADESLPLPSFFVPNHGIMSEAFVQPGASWV